jgi:hypothetical protein
MMGVSRGTISSIAGRETWTHIEESAHNHS